MQKKWSRKVKTHWHPPHDTFTKSAKEIAKIVAAGHADLASAIRSVQYYVNRAGANLTAADRRKFANVEERLRNIFRHKEKAKRQHVAMVKPRHAAASKTHERSPAKHAHHVKSAGRPLPRSNASYWFAWSTDPNHWRKGRSLYHYRAGSVHRYLGRKPMPMLGEGPFYLYSVTHRGKTARLAQKATPSISRG